MALVPIISQSWDTTSVFTPTRMNNIEQNLAIVSDATGVKYSNGVSVKDKIDGKAENISFTIPSTYTIFDTFCVQLANEIKNIGIANKIMIMDVTWTGHDNYYGEALWNGAAYVSIFMYNNDEIYRIFVNVSNGTISSKKKVAFTT